MTEAQVGIYEAVGYHPLPLDVQEISAFPSWPTLETLYIGRSTFFTPRAIVRTACDIDNARLRSVRIVGCTIEGIYGPLMRQKDIKDTAVTLREVVDLWGDADAVVARIDKIVRCNLVR